MQRYTFFQKQSVFRGKKCVLDCYFGGDACAEDERIYMRVCQNDKT